MIRHYPETALQQLEFDKIRELLAQKCRSVVAREKIAVLPVHTNLSIIQTELQRTHEFKTLLEGGQYFPVDDQLNLAREIKLLALPSGQLSGEQFLQIRRLAESVGKVFHWFDKERRIA